MRSITSSGIPTFVLVVGLCVSSARGQDQYEWISTEAIDNWNEDSNWASGPLNFVPNIDIAPGDTARISNGGIAQVSVTVPRIGELDLENGGVLIDGSGHLRIATSAGSSGALLADTNGRLDIQDSGQLTIETIATSLGTIYVTGPNVTAQIGSDFYMSGGTLGAGINSAGSHSAITVGGIANLGGTLLVDVSGAAPAFGQTWDLVNAASIQQMFDQVVVNSSPVLSRGLQYQAVQQSGAASLEVGNTLIVTLNRQTGLATLENVIGGPLGITGYAMISDGGALSPGGWQSFNSSGVAGTGWVENTPSDMVVGELNPESTFSLGISETVSLGNPYSQGVLPADEDVAFEFTTADGRTLEGIIEYEGAPNDFILYVDPTDGSAAIGNLSPFIEAPDLTGYGITSLENQLVPGNWTPFESTGEAGPGWDASPPLPNRLAELNLENSHLFSDGTLISLGQIFTPGGVQDLEFLYTVVGAQAQTVGTVFYGGIPAAGTPGDFDNDGDVDGDDFLIWQASFNIDDGGDADGDGDTDGDDFLLWQSNFRSASGAAGSAAVPEPGTLALLLLTSVFAGLFRSRR